MTFVEDKLSEVLGLPHQRSTELMSAITEIAQSSPGGGISLQRLAERTDEDPKLLKAALVVLLSCGAVRGRFIPYHKGCDKQIGKEEASVDAIESKAESGLYPVLCPGCRQYLDGYSDVFVRIVFSMPRVGT